MSESTIVKESCRIDKPDDYKYVHTDVPGWFNFENVYQLAVESCKDGDVLVEIGSFMGKSALYMMEQIQNSKKDLKFWCVDEFLINISEGDGQLPLNGPPIMASAWSQQYGIDGQYNAFKHFTANSVAAECLTGHIRRLSWEGAEPFKDESLAFVFLDAGHTYEAVQKDLLAWYPKIKSGGILAGHDYGDNNPANGVRLAVNEFAKERDLPIQSDYSFIIRKP